MNRLMNVSIAIILVSMLTSEGLAAQDALAVAVERIHRDYSSQQGKPDVGRLVLLDQELRDLIPYYQWQGRPWASASSFKPEHESIGVSPALFEPDFLTYSGKLLVEAHAVDPNSPFRSYTLYSTVFGTEGETSNGVPSPEAAEAYAREFPAGPFIIYAYAALAHFYDDLYKAIRLEETGERIDYKYDCFKAYVKAEPLPEQRSAAQESGIRYYEQLLRLLPQNEYETKYLADLRAGNNPRRWFFCGD